MDANELGRWTRFAVKGGIGKCTALQDCVAEQPEDLMFLKDDEITVLMHLPGQDDMYLGYCEGVVGRFYGASVHFHTRLKKPVIMKRSSSVVQTPVSRPSSSQSALTVFARDPTPAPSPSQQPPSALPPRSISGSTSYEQSAPDSHTQVSSLSLPASPLPPFHGYDESLHMRSVSYSSASTALESAPRTPADFSREDVQDGVRIVSSSGLRHSDSSITLHEADDHEINAPGDVQTEKLAKSFEPAHQHLHESEAIEDTSNTMYSSSEASTRISVALSDGEVGIGLSLLQDFANGDIEDDDAASVASSNRMYSSDLGPATIEDVPGSPNSTVEGHGAPSVRSFAPSFTPSIQSMAPSESNYSTSPVSTYSSLPAPRIPSRGSMHPSVSDSLEFGEEWEGASDIYDNYRYSRFSMASKMSRGSRASVHTVASFDVPPVPVDMRRPSMDNPPERAGKERAVENTMMTVRPANEAIRIPSPLNPIAQEAKALESKHIPPPLVLAHNSSHMTKASISSSGVANDSPLLHTSFGSPLSSTTPQLASHFSSQESFSSSVVPSIGGVASGLREKMELERNSDSGMNSRAESKSDMIGPISLTNDTIINNLAQESSHKSSSSTSETEHGLSWSETLSQQSFTSSGSQAKMSNASTSYPSEKKQPPTLVVVNPAPPPYDNDPPAISSSSHFLPNIAPPQVDSTPQQPIPRPQNLDRPPGSPVSRTSLFLPHPNAPKPTSTPIGPMYGRRLIGQAPSPSPPIGYPGSALQALHMALAARPRLVTIYGRCEWDLSMSMGPVPVLFGLEHPNNVPANRMGVAGRPPVNYPNGGYSGPSSIPPPQGPSAQIVGQQSSSAAAVSAFRGQQDANTDSNGEEADSASRAIPRANFFPQVPTTRPRSRSFSGFSSPIAEIELPVEKSLKESSQFRQSSSTAASTKRSKSASSTNSIASSRDITTPSMPAGRSTHAPSPLSLYQNNVVITPRSIPASLSHTVLPSPLSVSKPPLPQLSTNNLPVQLLVTDKTESPSLPSVSEASPVKSNNVHARTESPVSSPTAQSSNSPSRSNRLLRHSRSSVLSTSKQDSHLSLRRRRSGDTDISHYSDSRSITSSPPTGSSGPPAVARQGSLRSKLSLSILRTKSSERTLHQEDNSQTIQVQDMDFEIVQPVGATTVASDEDAASFTVPSPIRLDGTSFLRADSPAISMVSATSSRAPPSERSLGLPLSEINSPTPAHKSLSGNAEAHSHRELRWLNTLNAIPAVQARKTKKFRKLLVEGVPASVRCRVWAHLTDSKSKQVEGLYARLGKRERVASFNAIESDIRECFSNQPRLQDGSLLSLLQAYLTLVPDIHYDRGLTLIAGQLLMQSPEEDAFWTFISMMDAHVRLYFASNPIQLEVDAALFGKSLENNDSTLAKKLFVDMDIPPIEICRSWFTTLFVDTLPLEYAHRIWDLFLFEGVTFLFRVGLAIFSSSRRILLKSTSSESVLAFLRHPPTSCLPSDPDAFLELAFSVKLKDEDIRKQRSKMEAQAKRQTQARTLSTTGTRTPSISLPRA